MKTSRRILTVMANCHLLIWAARAVCATIATQLPLVSSAASVVIKACRSTPTRAPSSPCSSSTGVSVCLSNNRCPSKARYLWVQLSAEEINLRSGALNFSHSTTCLVRVSNETTASRSYSFLRSEASETMVSRDSTLGPKDWSLPVQTSTTSCLQSTKLS